VGLTPCDGIDRAVEGDWSAIVVTAVSLGRTVFLARRLP